MVKFKKTQKINAVKYPTKNELVKFCNSILDLVLVAAIAPAKMFSIAYNGKIFNLAKKNTKPKKRFSISDKSSVRKFLVNFLQIYSFVPYYTGC